MRQKISGEHFMKGSPSHLNLPMGVLKRVREYEGSSSLIGRNPALASRTEKTLELGIAEMTSFTVRIGWCSLFMTLLKSLGSIQIVRIQIQDPNAAQLTDGQ